MGVHVDFNKHGRYQLDRRLNLLLYLNKDWQEDYGGHFELWDRDMKNCVQKVLPVFNRVAIFSTTEHSWHGHPDPLNCPEDRSRKSLALYYYTNGRPSDEEAEQHSTVFKARTVAIEARDAVERRARGETTDALTTRRALTSARDMTRGEVRNGRSVLSKGARDGER